MGIKNTILGFDPIYTDVCKHSLSVRSRALQKKVTGIITWAGFETTTLIFGCYVANPSLRI